MVAWHKQQRNKYFDSFLLSITFLYSRLFTFKRHHYHQQRSILKPDSHLHAEPKMATLDSLKQVLRKKAEEVTPSPPKQPLSDAQYSKGLDVLKQGPGWLTYEDFIIPHTLQLLGPLFDSRTHVSVLETGPGPISLLSYLPRHLRNKVRKYKAFEPNSLFAARLGDALVPNSEQESLLPCMKSPPNICPRPFDVESNKAGGTSTSNSSLDKDEKYDAIILCHSMYGMNPKQRVIERALRMITGSPDHLDEGGLVLVFYRDNRALHFGNLASYRTACFPNGVVGVADNDEELDSFASFVAGFSVQEGADVGNKIRSEWRKVCRALGRREEHQKDRLIFSSPELMVAFSFCSNWLRELEDAVPLTKTHRTVKNREALLHHPVPVVKPKEIYEVQGAVQWALECNLSLTVIGGSHSGHCLRPNVVAVDMSAFNHIHIVMESQHEDQKSPALVVAETGCDTGDIIRTTLKEGLTVPLGARPSVGAGMWLQGGIGHLARLHGLTCDAMVGAVIVSVDNSSQVLCVGNVPIEHQPAGAIRPENEAELLWAIKGAGTNFGIVISLTFQAYPAPTFRIRNWVVKLDNNLDLQQKIIEFDSIVTKELPWNTSADAYLYWEDGQLHLGVTLFEASTDSPASSSLKKAMAMMDSVWGPSEGPQIMDGVGLFEAEMYVSRMHGGHGSGKTSSFKQCVFLKHIGEAEVSSHLVAAIETRPTPLCYLHLLQGGGGVSDVAADATAFGCRDWDFACVITGVWPRGDDGTDTGRCATQWVYNVAEDLLALSNCRGAYGADLGPDPRDSTLAAEAFGPNRRDVGRLKRVTDPQNVLAYACPLPKTLLEQKIIILVTGQSCAGKDFCADVWGSVFSSQLTARVVSISSATKREYAEASGADLGRLLWDRAYKEQRRPALTEFFKKQVRERPDLPEEQFLRVVRGAADVDVLLITGMRDEAPLAEFSHLVPESRLLEVYVQASEQSRLRRVGRDDGDGSNKNCEDNSNQSDAEVLPYRPGLVFINETSGGEAAVDFAKENLIPFLRLELRALAAQVDVVPDFPREGIDFRHVLGITQTRYGLHVCTSLLKSHFSGDWATVDSVACCEAGGFVFASPLALQVGLPLLLIREAGKLPPPTVSVSKNPSYVSSAISGTYTPEGYIELELDKVPGGPAGRVVVVDDVLSTGETMCAVLQLLEKAGVRAENVSIMVVAEFPVHRGRKLLLQHGFGKTSVQSLVVFGGA